MFPTFGVAVYMSTVQPYICTSSVTLHLVIHPFTSSLIESIWCLTELPTDQVATQNQTTIKLILLITLLIESSKMKSMILK